jgi:hypothetical protein
VQLSSEEVVSHVAELRLPRRYSAYSDSAITTK